MAANLLLIGSSVVSRIIPLDAEPIKEPPDLIVGLAEPVAPELVNPVAPDNALLGREHVPDIILLGNVVELSFRMVMYLTE